MACAWRKVKCLESEANLISLTHGQSFRWRLMPDGKSYVGVVDHQVLQVRRVKKYLHIRRIAKFSRCTKDKVQCVRDYFQLDTPLAPLYQQWSQADEHMAEVCRQYPGIRVLRQDPFECLITFICSSNNNIARIGQMIARMCEHLGESVRAEGHTFYDFPTIDALTQLESEVTLRHLGFGYRARFVAEAARMVLDRGLEWLNSLRCCSYNTVNAQLQLLPGVGRKVADCVSLMSLDKTDAIPVDTHIWQATVQHYLPELGNKQHLSPAAYQAIGDFYRKRFGRYAGWAHSVLFTDEVRKPKRNSCESQLTAAI